MIIFSGQSDLNAFEIQNKFVSRRDGRSHPFGILHPIDRSYDLHAHSLVTEWNKFIAYTHNNISV